MQRINRQKHETHCGGIKNENTRRTLSVNGSRNRIGHRVTVNLVIVGAPPEGLEGIIRAAIAAAFRPRR